MKKKEKKIQAKTIQKYKRVIDIWFTNGFNGADAYRQVYTNVKRPTTATVNFSKISIIPVIKYYIEEKQEAAAKIINVTHEGILSELKNWIEADITETICLTPEEIKELPITIRRLITKYTIVENEQFDKDGNQLSKTKTIALHFVSKEKAIEMINKHIGFYEKDNEQKNKADLSTLSTAELLARAKIIREVSENG